MKFNYINDLSVKITGITLRCVKFNLINGLSVKIIGDYCSFCELQQMREMNVTSYAVENLFKKVITTFDQKFLFPKKIENLFNMKI